MRTLRLVASLALAAIVLIVGQVGPAVANASELAAPIASLESLESTLLDLTNADRLANGLGPVAFDDRLMAIARERAAASLNTPSLSHYDATGGLIFAQLLDGAFVPYLLAGENLARANNIDIDGVSRVQDALMRSPLHRKNILEPAFNEMAVGVARNDSGTVTFAEIFRAAP